VVVKLTLGVREFFKFRDRNIEETDEDLSIHFAQKKTEKRHVLVNNDMHPDAITEKDEAIYADLFITLQMYIHVIVPIS
jgi:hypothetical protein